MDKQSVSERELKVQVLSLEYQTLRAAIMNQTAASYQFLGLAATAAAILATGAGRLSFSSGGWVLAILAGGIFVFGVGAFRLLGRYVAFLSQRVAVIEEKINSLVPGEESLLSWESDRQNRSRYERWVVGHQIPKKYESRDPG
jgi:hypothetical protein